MDSGFTPTVSLDQLANNFHIKVGEVATVVEHVSREDFNLQDPVVYSEIPNSVGVDHLLLSVIKEEEHNNQQARLFKRKYKLKAIKKGECFIKFPKDKKIVKFTITE